MIHEKCDANVHNVWDESVYILWRSDEVIASTFIGIIPNALQIFFDTQ